MRTAKQFRASQQIALALVDGRGAPMASKTKPKSAAVPEKLPKGVVRVSVAELEDLRVRASATLDNELYAGVFGAEAAAGSRPVAPSALLQSPTLTQAQADQLYGSVFGQAV